MARSSPVNIANQRIVLLARARALQARAGHQGRRLHQVFRRPEADLRQVDDHQRRRALAEDPHAAAAGVPSRTCSPSTSPTSWTPSAPRWRSGPNSRNRARPVEMVEQTWTLAADMICKALFDRDMPFNPHFVFKCVKTYTDVMNHKEIRLKKTGGRRSSRSTEEDAAKAMEIWASVPPAVIRRRSARGARAHAAEDDRGGRRRSDHAGVRPAAGHRRAEAVPVGRHRDDGADARLGAL